MLGVLRVDGFGVAFTVFCCVTGFVTILATMRGEAFRRPGGEFLVLILSAVLRHVGPRPGGRPGHALPRLRDRLDPRRTSSSACAAPTASANEASMKYVLFGAVSSGLMLYGLSMIVGLAGGTSLEAVSQRRGERRGAPQPMFVVAARDDLRGLRLQDLGRARSTSGRPTCTRARRPPWAASSPWPSKAAGFAALVRVVGAMSPAVPDAADPLTTFAYAGDPLVLASPIARRPLDDDREPRGAAADARSSACSPGRASRTPATSCWRSPSGRSAPRPRSSSTWSPTCS